MVKLVRESIDIMPQYIDDENLAPEKRSGEQTKYRYWVLEHVFKFKDDKPLWKYVIVENPDLFNQIKNRESNVTFDRQVVPRSKHALLVPYGTLTKGSSRTKKKPYFTVQEWYGKDKFGNKNLSPEVRNIKRNSISFRNYINQ